MKKSPTSKVKRPTQKEITIIIKALDALGSALVKHGHKWSNKERFLYEQAVYSLGSGCATEAKVLA